MSWCGGTATDPIAHTSRDNNQEVSIVPRILSSALSTTSASKPGEPVTVEGSVHRRRQLATVTFVVVRDRSGFAQVVVTDSVVRGEVANLPEETVVRVTGTLAANEKAPGGVEIVEPTITALSEPSQPQPVELWRPKLKAPLPTMLDHAALIWRISLDVEFGFIGDHRDVLSLLRDSLAARNAPHTEASPSASTDLSHDYSKPTTSAAPPCSPRDIHRIQP
ncbi:OB-fold nucleic acid binding domain-containing protein [Rhodococcus sp. ABRD24]|uniref:OB-fold nucleic acid binding domain-containing protein n=1 Tax=Rhodococcus sp. ABRD24 TaxID=2507582 RepID=UPI001F61069A|nr:OB-fold nucleic acid binding domain-containing protein [Rhodococcus sp. ABRD24]